MGSIPSIEKDEQWLSLTDYSVETGISLSTLRRRIKKNDIAFKLENGKYFLSLNTSEKQEVSSPPKMEDALHLIAEAFEFNLKEKDKEISSLQKEKKELESRVKELSHLVEILEKKFKVSY